MTDAEIENYLIENNYRVDPSDCIHKVFNTSPQILDKIYNFDNRIMTIITPNNKFTFEWVLRELFKENKNG